MGPGRDPDHHPEAAQQRRWNLRSQILVEASIADGRQKQKLERGRER